MADNERESSRPIQPYRIINVGPDIQPPKPAPVARPVVRKPTILGIPASGAETTDQKIRAIEQLAAAFRAKRSYLSPRTNEVEKTVTAAMHAANRRFSRTSVISIGQFRQTFNGLPCAVRDEALAGLRTGIANGTMTPLTSILQNASGYVPAAAERAIVSSVKVAVEQAEAWFNENLSSLVPKQVTEGLRATVGYHVMGLANGDATRVTSLAAFTGMWLCGHVPVGVMTDNSFLVLVA